jgi:hypothetical protein
VLTISRDEDGSGIDCVIPVTPETHTELIDVDHQRRFLIFSQTGRIVFLSHSDSDVIRAFVLAIRNFTFLTLGLSIYLFEIVSILPIESLKDGHCVCCGREGMWVHLAEQTENHL